MQVYGWILFIYRFKGWIIVQVYKVYRLYTGSGLNIGLLVGYWLRFKYRFIGWILALV